MQATKTKSFLFTSVFISELFPFAWIESIKFESVKRFSPPFTISDKLERYVPFEILFKFDIVSFSIASIG